MKNNIYWILEVTIKQGEFNNFKALMKEQIETTQANEPGTLNYEWSITADKQSCHIYERYVDSAAAITHLESFEEKFAERFMAVAKPTRHVVYGTPNDELKEVLSGSGAMFMAPFGGFAR